MSASLPEPLADAIERRIATWDAEGRMARLWDGDPGVWSGSDEGRWLGWLHVIGEQLGRLEPLRSLQEEVRRDRFGYAVVLGMGGSSLGPEVLGQTFGRVSGAPELLVLDSTDPAQIRAVESRLRYESTLFIVSSKSGTTLESTILYWYFADRARRLLGSEAGAHFLAVTDPGSELESIAAGAGFRHVFNGVPSIGGRFSVLSPFGLVPAAVMGVDVAEILTRAQAMQVRCGPQVPLPENPGAALGLILGTAAQAGRDKVTFVGMATYPGLGAWLEQLLAESTGKDGQGLIPVDGEDLGPPSAYGEDRLFVYLRDSVSPDRDEDEAIRLLETAGHPVVRIDAADRLDLGAEFFRWEFATAVAGSVLQLNPFDQPDVEASKEETRRLTTLYEREGHLPVEPPLAQDGRLTLHADPVYSRALRDEGAAASVAELLAAHCRQIAPGDYVALLAYIERSAPHTRILQEIRAGIRRRWGVATCVGFGPRFLHSTGQAYKGGPNTGVFFQITCDDAIDLDVPGRPYSFGVVKKAQAHGDFQVLVDRKRRAVRIHLGGGVGGGLRQLADVMERVSQGTR